MDPFASKMRDLAIYPPLGGPSTPEATPRALGGRR